MIVCHCHAKSDLEVRDAVRSGARSTGNVKRACSAGSGCGGCIPVIEEIIRSESHGPASAFSSNPVVERHPVS